MRGLSLQGILRGQAAFNENSFLTAQCRVGRTMYDICVEAKLGGAENRMRSFYNDCASSNIAAVVGRFMKRVCSHA